MRIIKTSKYVQAAWGKAGAGILFTCKEDGTAMLLMRSGSVLDPYMWGVPGGAVKGTEGHYDDRSAGTGTNYSDEELWDTARGETVQELYGQDEHDFNDNLFPKQHNRHPQKVIFDTNPNNPNSFKYYTFVVDIPLAEKQQIIKNATLNWENDEMKWMPIQELMQHVTPIEGSHGELANGDRLHKGVSHVLRTHPSFVPQKEPKRTTNAPMTPARHSKKPPTNQMELFD